jgi:hypothetical protein
MDNPLLSVVRAAGVLVTLALTVVTVLAMRKPRRVTALAALVAGLLSLGVLAALVALSGARLSPVVAVPVLAVGAVVGLIRGITTRLTYRDGQVWAQTRGCVAALWGGSLIAAQLLITLGSVLWAALGLIPIYLSTGNEVVYQAVLFLRRLFYKPRAPIAARAR